MLLLFLYLLAILILDIILDLTLGTVPSYFLVFVIALLVQVLIKNKVEQMKMTKLNRINTTSLVLLLYIIIALLLDGLKDVEIPGIFTITFLAVLCPFTEEIVFRYKIFRNACLKNPIAAIILSSLAFAIVHYDLFQSVMAFATGCVMGYVSYKFGFKNGWLMHICVNLLSVYINTRNVFLFLVLIFITLISSAILLKKSSRTASD